MIAASSAENAVCIKSQSRGRGGSYREAAMGHPVEYLPVPVRWQHLAWSVVAGVGLAAFYTITPLTLCVVALAITVIPLLARGLSREERRWLTAVLVVSVAA